jgi:adenosylcobinamide kinase/adenosylcobinamide-phosphate guanylyltransferase
MLRIFISGGCKNGKSYIAQRLAKCQSKGGSYYLATMRPCDNEDIERIERHRREREGWGYTTIEQPVDILKCLDFCDINASFLLDSTTALLANEMFPADNNVNMGASRKIAGELVSLCKQVNDIVVVSDYIYSDAVLYDELTEAYRKGLALIDRTLAAVCDVVLEIAFGSIIIHKGREVFMPFYEKIL